MMAMKTISSWWSMSLLVSVILEVSNRNNVLVVRNILPSVAAFNARWPTKPRRRRTTIVYDYQSEQQLLLLRSSQRFSAGTVALWKSSSGSDAKKNTPDEDDSNTNGDEGEEDGGSSYRFGDLTRGIMGRFQRNVNSLTGKPSYQFGDLSNYLDQRAKGAVVNLDAAAKERVNGFTQQSEYRFGDISRELIRRFRAGEYEAEDIWLFLKIVSLIGMNLQPVAATLPMKVLVELLEVSVGQKLSEKVVGTLTQEVDNRMKQFFVGDKDYRLGDLTKIALTGSKVYEVGDLTKRAVARFTGKESYDLGDITKKLTELRNQPVTKHTPSTKEGKSSDSSSSLLGDMDQSTLQELEEWDKQFLIQKEKHPDTTSSTTTKEVEEQIYQQWDEQLLASEATTAKTNRGATT